MKEIGGYLGLEQMGNHSYYPNLLALNTGRNALAYLIKARAIRKLYIPYFLCDSVSSVCQREGCRIGYYPIGADFLPILPEEPEADSWIYVVNYYGQISNTQLMQWKLQWKNIIFDNVQAFFQKPVSGVDTIYSCRKFFGVPDGAYLATDAQAIALEDDSSRERMKHILGRFETGCASAFYADFKENDRSFQDLPLRRMSPLTRNLLAGLDYDAIREKRNANWALLHSALSSHNQLTLIATDGPYCYPFYCENGMEVKRRLAEMKIYVPTLWPNVYQMGEGLEKDYAQNILPLPCDQRYDGQDMARIADALLLMM